MHKDTLLITIPKSYNFENKYNDIMNGGYAWYESKNMPRKPYKYVGVIWKGMLFMFNKCKTNKGIGFYDHLETRATAIKGFQGFRYMSYNDAMNYGVIYNDQ